MTPQLWNIRTDPNTYRSLDPVDQSPAGYLDLMNHLRSGGPVDGLWPRLRVELFEEEGEEQKPVGDFLSLAGTIPLALSARALDVLRPVVADEAEILELESSGGEFLALNVFSCDCLDLTKSVVRTFSTGRIMEIEQYSFLPERLRARHLFRIPEEIMSRTFVDAVFKKTVELNNLRGLMFSPVPQTMAAVKG